MAKGENIYKRKDGRWEGRYKKGYDKDRKIQYGYCYGHSYRETKEKLNRAKAEFMLNRPSVSKDIYKKNLADYCVQWLKINENRLKRSTLAKYNSMLEKHIKPQLGDYNLAELDSDIIADFSNDLLHQKQLSIKTVRDILIFKRKKKLQGQAKPDLAILHRRFLMTGSLRLRRVGILCWKTVLFSGNIRSGTAKI